MIVIPVIVADLWLVLCSLTHLLGIVLVHVEVVVHAGFIQGQQLVPEAMAGWGQQAGG